MDLPGETVHPADIVRAARGSSETQTPSDLSLSRMGDHKLHTYITRVRTICILDVLRNASIIRGGLLD
jgi:hypothetical protein